MTTVHHTPILNGAPALAATFNDPLGQLDAAIVAADSAKADTDLSNLTSPTAINQTLLPSGTRSLGGSTNWWEYAYLDRLVLRELTAPSPPSGSSLYLYVKSDGRVYYKNDLGVEYGPLAAGTVTSVGLSMPSEFSVTNSPVTSSNTLTVTKANQNANQVYAGPSSGAAAQPAFRALVTADIPIIYGARVTLSASQSISNGVTTSISFSSAHYDTGSMWSAGSPTRLTAPVNGIYVISAGAVFAANSTGMRQIQLRISGVDDLAMNSGRALASGLHEMAISTVHYFTAGQYVEVQVYQDSGGALNVLNATRSHLSMAMVGRAN